jgi:spore germination protein YaaH
MKRCVMIHILRENETIDDISALYGVESEKIGLYNKTNTFKTNQAIWIPVNKKLVFLEEEETIFSLCEKYDFKQSELLPLNQNQITYEKDDKVVLPSTQTNRFEIYSIYSLKQEENILSDIDEFAQHLDGVFLDGYTIENSTLKIPVDYMAINNCLINKLEVCFVLNNISGFTETEIMDSLLADLTFKEYTNALVYLNSVDDIAMFDKVRDNLFGYGINLSVCASDDVLYRLMDSDQILKVYYLPKKNSFDFDSFDETITSLLKIFPAEKLGYVCGFAMADINKTNVKIAYPDISVLEDYLLKYEVHEISFDDDSQLCLIRYSDGDDEHNVIFEDVRTIYAKLKYLLDKGVSKILTPKTDSMISIVNNIKELF